MERYHFNYMNTKSLPLIASIVALAAFAFSAFDAMAQDSAGLAPAESPANATSAIRELTEDGAPTPEFMKTFIRFSTPHNDTGDENAMTHFQINSIKVPYRTDPTISFEKWKEYQENGKIPFFLSAFLWRGNAKVPGETAHFVILDAKGKALVKETVSLDSMDFRKGYWGELPSPGQYTLVLWTKTSTGAVFGGSRKIDFFWPVDPADAPPVQDLTADGIPTQEFQKQFLPFGRGYHYDPERPEVMMFLQMDDFKMPSVSAAEASRHRKDGSVPFFLATSLCGSPPANAASSAIANFVILDTAGKVAAKDSMTLDKLKFSYTNARLNGYTGKLPKEGRYTLILWATMESGVVFGGRRDNVYFILPPSAEQDGDDAKEAGESEADESALASAIFKELSALLRQPPKRGNAPAQKHAAKTNAEQSQNAEPAVIDIDCDAVIERLNQDEDEKSDSSPGKEARLSYISLLEQCKETGRLASELVTDKNRRTLLMCAAEFRHADVVEALLAAGADVNARDRSNKTALHIAARAGDAGIVKALIGAGARVDSFGNRGETAMFAAIVYGRLDVVKELIAGGANIELGMGEWGDQTALILAAKKQNTSIVKELLAAGADIHAKDREGSAALRGAARAGNIETIELLLAAGADINAHGKERGTALLASFLSEGDRAATALALIAAGADVNLTREFGTTPLMSAVKQGYLHGRHKEVIQALVAVGADIEARDNAGRTALHIAVDDKHNIPDDGVQALLAVGADVNAKDKEGRTALICALEHNSPGIVKLRVAEALVAAGADTSAKDNNGRTALHLAELTGTITPGAKNNVGKFFPEHHAKILELLKGSD